MKISRYAILIAGLSIGCGGTTRTSSGNASPDGSVVVVRGTELSGSLLEGLRTRLPTMRVNTQTSGCPQITFRGQRSARNQGNPTVYIDETMMVDTCILQQINAIEVDRVEIYPSGNTSKPGIQRNAFGVIIVYRINR